MFVNLSRFAGAKHSIFANIIVICEMRKMYLSPPTRPFSS